VLLNKETDKNLLHSSLSIKVTELMRWTYLL